MVVTLEIFEKIYYIVLAELRSKVRIRVEAIGISHGSAVFHSNGHLGMRKPFARWMPCLLKINHGRNGVITSKDCLALFNRNPDDLCVVSYSWTKYGLIIADRRPSIGPVKRVDLFG